MKYNFPRETHSILPCDPVELFVRISQGRSRVRGRSPAELHSVCPGFAPVGPCGAMPECHQRHRFWEIQESFIQHSSAYFIFQSF